MSDSHEREIKGFTRTRNGSGYINDCSSGYDFGPARVKNFVGIHHIVCIDCLDDGNIEPLCKKNFPYIKLCMQVTDWDINTSHNTIALPLKKVFHFRHAARHPDLPCHDVDHPQYIDWVNAFLTTNLWRELVGTAEKCQDKGASIAWQLSIASEAFRQELELRGKENGGAKFCWENRNQPGMASLWYVPFSMAKEPRARKAPGEGLGWAAVKKVWLKIL